MKFINKVTFHTLTQNIYTNIPINIFKKKKKKNYMIGYDTKLKFIRLSNCNQKYVGCPSGVMENRRKRVWTPVALLCSLSGKYPWERYEPPYPPSYGLNSITTILQGE